MPIPNVANEAWDTILAVLRLPEWVTRMPWKPKAIVESDILQKMIEGPFRRTQDIKASDHIARLRFLTLCFVQDDASKNQSFTLDMLSTETSLTEEQVMFNSGSSSKFSTLIGLRANVVPDVTPSTQ